jgi:hypothetical protein
MGANLQRRQTVVLGAVLRYESLATPARAIPTVSLFNVHPQNLRLNIADCVSTGSLVLACDSLPGGKEADNDPCVICQCLNKPQLGEFVYSCLQVFKALEESHLHHPR